MGVAADCEYTAHYGNAQEAKTQIIADWNGASAMYKVSSITAPIMSDLKSVHSQHSMSAWVLSNSMSTSNSM